MDISSKAAYLKGLMDGLSIDSSSDEGKLFEKIIDLLGDLARAHTELQLQVDDIDYDLADVEDELDDLYDDDYDEDDDLPFDDYDDEYEVLCPHCKEVVTLFDEDVDINDFSALCPKCGKKIPNVFESQLSFYDNEEDNDDDDDED